MKYSDYVDTIPLLTLIGSESIFMKQNIYREFNKMNNDALCVLSQLAQNNGRGYSKAFPLLVTIIMCSGETGELDATAATLADIAGISSVDVSFATKRLVEWGFIEYKVRRSNHRGNLYRLNPSVVSTVSETEYQLIDGRQTKVANRKYVELFKKYHGLPLRLEESKPFIARIKDKVKQIFTTL